MNLNQNFVAKSYKTTLLTWYTKIHVSPSNQRPNTSSPCGNTIHCILHNKELSPVTHRKDNSLFLPRIDHPCSLWQCSVYFLLITLYLSSLRWYLQYRHLPGTNLNLHSNCKTNEHGSLLQCVVMNKYLGSKDKAIMKLPDGSVAKIGQEKMKIRFLIQET